MIPGELDGSVPRDVRLTRGGIVVTTVAVVFAIAAVAAAVVLSAVYAGGVTVGDEGRPLPIWIIPLAVGALLEAAWLLARSVRRQWVLLSEGRGAQATVTAFKKIRKDKQTAYRVSCEFRSLSGATHVARFDIAKAPPAIGATVAVVYHRDQPDWNARYPFQLVRPTHLRP